MTRSALNLGGAILALGGLAGCEPGPKAAPPAPAAVAPSPAPPPPGKKTTMICRNSQDGRAVECGTPNAVMVGIKTE